MSIDTESYEQSPEMHVDGLRILVPERYNEFAHLLATIPRPEDVRKGKSRHLSVAEEGTYPESINKNHIVVGCDLDGALRGGVLGVVQDKELYLTDGVVDPLYRGKGLLAKMDELLVTSAKEKGCEYIRTDVSIYNPASLAANFNMGFIAYGASSDYLFLVKDIHTHDQEEDVMFGEVIEISLASLKDIGPRFTQGYVAVDVKNVYAGYKGVEVGMTEDMNPNHWTIIMRKADPGILPWNRTIQ